MLRGIAGGVAGLSLAPVARVGLAPRRVDRRARGAGHHAAQRRRRQHRRARDGRRQGRRRQRRRGARATPCVAALDELPGGSVADACSTRIGISIRSARTKRFGSAGATIIAHEKTRLRLTHGYYVPDRGSLREAAARSRAGRRKTFFTNDATDRRRAERIEYGYLHRGAHRRRHLCGFPDANVIAVGDVVSPRARPRARLVRRRLARRARRCAGEAARAQRRRHAVRAELRSRALAAPRCRPSTT